MFLNNKFPLYLPGIATNKNQDLSVIAVDLRENNTTIALFELNDGGLNIQEESTYQTQEFESFSELVNRFTEENTLKNISRISVAVPGPVINNHAYSERLNWELNVEEIQTKTKSNQVFLINDLEASAYGLAVLSDECLIPIYEPKIKSKGNMAILSPGNGLGEAGLFFDGECLRPFATEGGHSEFSPRTNVEVEFYQFLNQIYGIVSWENVLSKNGMFNIFRFLRDDKRHPQSEKLIQRLKEKDFVEAIFLAAIEDNEQIATITLNTYLEFLAREANNLVLKLKATGGLLIGGDIPNMIKDYIDKDRFYQKFKISDKMEKVLKNIPLHLIASEKTTLNGAAYYAAFSEK